jgi:hypothetical protein
MITKAAKKQLIEQIVERINSGRVSGKNIGFLIRTIHFVAPLTVLSTIINGTHVTVVLQILFMILSMIAFFIFDGCIVSMIESRLCKDDILIIDPFLEIAGYEVTNRNRKYGTYLIGGSYIISIILIYFYRFWF